MVSARDEADDVGGNRRKYARARLQWLGITSGIMVLSWLVSNLIPFFKDFVALIGAVEAVPLAFLKAARSAHAPVDPGAFATATLDVTYASVDDIRGFDVVVCADMLYDTDVGMGVLNDEENGGGLTAIDARAASVIPLRLSSSIETVRTIPREKRERAPRTGARARGQKGK